MSAIESGTATELMVILHGDPATPTPTCTIYQFSEFSSRGKVAIACSFVLSRVYVRRSNAVTTLPMFHAEHEDRSRMLVPLQMPT